MRLIVEGKASKEMRRSSGSASKPSSAIAPISTLKLKVDSVAELVRYAIRGGLVDI